MYDGRIYRARHLEDGLSVGQAPPIATSVDLYICILFTMTLTSTLQYLGGVFLFCGAGLFGYDFDFNFAVLGMMSSCFVGLGFRLRLGLRLRSTWDGVFLFCGDGFRLRLGLALAARGMVWVVYFNFCLAQHWRHTDFNAKDKDKQGTQQRMGCIP